MNLKNYGLLRELFYGCGDGSTLLCGVIVVLRVIKQ